MIKKSAYSCVFHNIGQLTKPGMMEHRTVMTVGEGWQNFCIKRVGIEQLDIPYIRHALHM